MKIHVKKINVYLIFALLFLFTKLNCLIALAKDINTTPNNEFQQFHTRLERLEPKVPMDIPSEPIYNIPIPSKVLSVPYIILNGKRISYELIFNDPSWKRPAYRTYWHSTMFGGRWSYVPERINYALHRVFTTYPTASVYYDFLNNLGISDKVYDLDIKYNGPYNKILVIAMNSNIKTVFTLGNQVVLVTEPSRTGLQAITIPTSAIHPYNTKDAILFQLVTPEGYEIDYSLIYKQ